MITIQSKYAQPPQSVCEYQSTLDGRYGWFLCVAHEENDLALEEIQAEVKLEVLNARVLEISRMEIENWLKGFFADLHWKLHASLRRSELREKGLSLFFAVCYDHDIYFVQFGRIFCAATKGKKLEIVGSNWKNYHVQALRDLNLLGLSEEDIRVKPRKFHLDENESLMVLPGKIAAKVWSGSADVGSLQPLIESFNTASPALWLILRHQTSLVKARKRRLSKLEISTLILLLGTILAILYMAFGNRVLEVFLHRSHKEAAETRLRAGTEILQNIGRVVNSPARSIELTLDWNAQLPHKVTSEPVFNQQGIYLASGADLFAYRLATREQLWQKSCDAPIANILATAQGLNITLANGQTLGLDAEGNTLWSQQLQERAEHKPQLRITEITPIQDKRIDKSITVVPLQRGIAVLDSHQGTVMSELKLNQDLSFLSRYDDYNNCFYAVMGQTLVRVDLKIVN
ncbi:MAG: PQQ-binding-like beta-propeller repeat protein [Candidatus Cloacimonetes bacterium]|nr:PQQ-binding-like beta-propeller repeat protein [Candidatus Cloacimonadota bacterium]